MNVGDIMKKQILNTINERSSYRGLYKNIPVPKEDLTLIMEAGLSAPSGCNKQTTSLIAVDDFELLVKMKQVIKPPICETAPAFICVLTQKIRAYKNISYNVQDYAAAVENMLLAIKALGYESCWYEGNITAEGDIARKLADILGVPDDYELVCLLPVGYADEPTKRVKKRPFNERAWFNGFGNKTEEY